MQYKKDNFTIYVEQDYEQMSNRAAEVFCGEVKLGKVFGFATGSTPIGMYDEIIKLYKAGAADFSKITSFNLDEYYPIKKSNDQSYDYFMRKQLFDHININPQSIHIPNGETTDADAECIAYEKAIKAAGGIDMQLLGIGLNGHIGFNEPSDCFEPNTHVVELEQSTIEANSRFFNDISEVPIKALTMGIKTIMSAKKVLLIVSGAKKAEILKETIFGKISPKVQSTILQLHNDVTIVADEEAAAIIKAML